MGNGARVCEECRQALKATDFTVGTNIVLHIYGGEDNGTERLSLAQDQTEKQWKVMSAMHCFWV